MRSWIRKRPRRHGVCSKAFQKIWLYSESPRGSTLGLSVLFFDCIVQFHKLIEFPGSFEFKFVMIVTSPEQGDAVTKNDWRHCDRDFINQPLLQVFMDQFAAAHDPNIPAFFFLQ